MDALMCFFCTGRYSLPAHFSWCVLKSNVPASVVVRFSVNLRHNTFTVLTVIVCNHKIFKFLITVYIKNMIVLYVKSWCGTRVLAFGGMFHLQVILQMAVRSDMFFQHNLTSRQRSSKFYVILLLLSVAPSFTMVM